MTLETVAFYTLGAALLASVFAAIGLFDPSIDGLRFGLNGPSYNYAIESRVHAGPSTRVDVWVDGTWKHYFLGLGRPLLGFPILVFLLILLFRRATDG